MTQGDLLKDVGMALAIAAAPDLWKELATDWIASSRTGRQFTSDDLVEACGLPRASGPNPNNAVGAFPSGMARKGRIRDTGQWVKSQRVQRHSGKVSVWEVCS